MLRKLIIAAAFCAASSTLALAQTSGAGSADGTGTNAVDDATGAAKTPGVLDDPVAMKPFYTDDTMTTTRSMDEIRAAMKEMNQDDKTKITEECKNVNTQRSSFCKAFNDSNQM